MLFLYASTGREAASDCNDPTTLVYLAVLGGRHQMAHPNIAVEDLGRS
jgi:hypothetical protein